MEASTATMEFQVLESHTRWCGSCCCDNSCCSGHCCGLHLLFQSTLWLLFNTIVAAVCCTSTVWCLLLRLLLCCSARSDGIGCPYNEQRQGGGSLSLHHFCRHLTLPIAAISIFWHNLLMLLLYFFYLWEAPYQQQERNILNYRRCPPSTVDW